ncbi:MAG TPA: HAMP domain-containing sensor histidine kinase [Propionibacteriaceae bacterium]|nr:HAMP domain-containing sensor histidine kinase [Propionibacteriaceae bacterium]HQE31927.1 HAMP domain-containing sensor histidine kinase [Propionibacteriaceae bacterium]
MRPRLGWLGSLGTRLAVAMVALVVVTATATAISGVVLLRRADDSAGRRGLAMVADSVAAQVSAGANAAEAASTVGTSTVRVAVVTRGRVTGEQLARSATTPDVVELLDAGKPVSKRSTVQGVTVFIEGRPTNQGGVVLVQRRADALGLVDQVVPQWLWLVAGIGVLAGVVGLLLAWRVARPIRRLSDAMTALSAGERRAVTVGGPTEVQALAEEINLLSAQLAHAEARQREFLVSVSHDLRTPLATIAGYAESLSDDAVPSHELAGVGRVLADESARLDRMVADLLDLARAEADELRFQIAEVDCRDLVSDAGRVWRERCATAGQPFTLELPTEHLLVSADPQRLRQALDGLLDNAVRVTPAGRPIVLASTQVGPDAVISVRDGGPGLTDDDLAVAFDRGALHERYRGRRQVGTGVGLALVDRLIRRQGGTVIAAHAPEGGAAFTISLPRLAASEASRPG